MSETDEATASDTSTAGDSILESLPPRPIPLSYLSELTSTDKITDAVALIAGGGPSQKLMLQFLLQTHEKTFILTLPGQESDPAGWSVLVEIDGADEQAYQEALLEAKVWREERGLSEDDEDIKSADELRNAEE